MAGVMIWKLTESGGSTQVTLTCAVGGYRQGGLRPLAMPVDGVLRDQLARLKRFGRNRTRAGAVTTGEFGQLVSWSTGH